ncbi:MAG: 50S ribosomal protein L13 [Candidatus Omnitrophica bacterium]|nr:50S ribosomal protein L13 [Candidatus Omnitrophota bacterium]
MKTSVLKKEAVKRVYFTIDAAGIVLGRLSTQVAAILSGKCKPDFTPYVDSGDAVIITNAAKIKITGKKTEQKFYARYSGYPGGFKAEKLETLLKRKPEDVIRYSVWGMLPKNKFQKDMISRLKIYAGDKHPHQAQMPAVLKTGRKKWQIQAV